MDVDQPDSSGVMTWHSEEPTTQTRRQKETVLPKLICTPAEASAVLNKRHMENLFLDLMFFLRHGLAQPPSCKKCALRNAHVAMKETNEGDCDVDTSFADADDQKCRRVVLWRRDAKLDIETSNLQTNIVVLDCHSVGHLLIGERVGTFVWNEAGKFLVDFAGEKLLGSTSFERTHGLAMLLHASKCKADPGMCTENCQKIQTILRHFRTCQPLLHGSDCDLCGCIKPLIKVHSELCTIEMACSVPGCAHLKAHRAKTSQDVVSRITELA